MEDIFKSPHNGCCAAKRMHRNSHSIVTENSNSWGMLGRRQAGGTARFVNEHNMNGCSVGLARGSL